MVKLARAIASGFGVGYAPFLSGSWGSLQCVILWCLASHIWGPFPLQDEITIIIVCTVIGTLACFLLKKVDRDPRCFKEGRYDPSFIIIDEWAGMLIALIGVSHLDWVSIGAAFLLFRIFDIIKPPPAAQAEHIPWGIGVMADDIIAGLMALGCMKAGIALLGSGI